MVHEGKRDVPGSAEARGNRERGRGRGRESERIELWLAVVDRNWVGGWRGEEKGRRMGERQKDGLARP